jgi:hypothetical protein
MTRHSTLNNASDLHYAKVRSFNGDPRNVKPDFIDQLIVSKDTNKAYRAFGVNEGNIVELVDGGGSFVEIRGDYPLAPPSTAGLMFLLRWTSQLYISVDNGYGVIYWKPVQWTGDFFSLKCQALYDDPPYSEQATFSILYSPLSPEIINADDFDFSIIVQPNIQTSLTPLDLSFVLRGVGRGAYSVSYTVENPNNYFLLGSLTQSSSNLSSCFTLISSPNEITAFGQRLSNKYLFYSGDIALEPLELAFEIRKISIEL